MAQTDQAFRRIVVLYPHQADLETEHPRYHVIANNPRQYGRHPALDAARGESLPRTTSRSLSQALAWSACPAIRKVPTPHSSGLGFCPQSLHALQSLRPRRGLAVASRGYRALATLPNSGPTEPSRRDPGTEASCRRGRLFVDIRHTVTPPSTAPRDKALAHPEYFTNRSAASQGEDYPAPRDMANLLLST